MLLVEIHALPDGVHSQTLRLEPEALDLDPALFADVVVDLRLDVGGQRVLAQYEVRAVATLECDRTLVEFAQRVAGSHAVLFAPPEQLPGGPSDDAFLLPADALAIDLTAPVRDTLLLALPAKRIAPGAEDLEIPTAFGADLDAEGRLTDPRWDALRRLRDADGEDAR
jgi:uncharacterized protein